MIYDVSVAITNDLPTWPTDPGVKLTTTAHLSDDKTQTIRVTAIEMSAHTGTHIDAPWHFLEGGKKLNEIPLDALIGPALVVHIPDGPSISRASLEHLDWRGVERVLFKTSNSEHWTDKRFNETFVYLEPEAAELLVQHGIRLVGIDYLSIDPFKSQKHPSHFVLLGNNVVVLEGLNLANVTPGRYQMTALPLNLQDVDGAPTRVILSDE
jgi:arylformamidase